MFEHRYTLVSTNFYDHRQDIQWGSRRNAHEMSMVSHEQEIEYFEQLLKERRYAFYEIYECDGESVKLIASKYIPLKKKVIINEAAKNMYSPTGSKLRKNSGLSGMPMPAGAQFLWSAATAGPGPAEDNL